MGGECYRGGSFIRDGLDWSPDGRYLHYAYLGGDQDGASGHFHYVIDVNTGEEKFAFMGQYGQFAWSPNGEYFAFTELDIPKFLILQQAKLMSCL